MSAYPAIVIAIWNDDLKLVKQLSGDPDVLDLDGRTPLIAASIDSKIDAAKILIAAGADLNFQDRDGWSALHFAAQAGSVDMTYLLLEAGAKVDPVDSYGNTPLSTAVFHSRDEGDTIQLLRHAGADPLAENNHGVSPLSLAHTIGNYDIAQFFPEQQSRNGPDD